VNVTTKTASIKEGPTVISDGVWYPERIACSADGRTAAYVVDATRAGATDQSGIWIGLIGTSPSKLTDEVPSTNLAFGIGSADSPSGAVLAYALSLESKSEIVIRNLKLDTVRRHDLRGVAEAVAWTPDGGLLVLLAEPGADTASLSSGKPLSSEAPPARSNRNLIGWRRVWRLDPETGVASALSPVGLTVWEFAPMNDGRIVAIASPDPSEGGWYRSVLTVLGPTPASQQDLHVPTWQIAGPTVSPDGSQVAFLEGWSSDRGLGSGDIRVVDLATGAISDVASAVGVDATWLQWAADNRLWFAGWQGLGMTWGWIDSPASANQTASMHPEAASLVNSPWHPQVVPIAAGRALTVRSSVDEPPEVSILSTTGEAAVGWSILNAAIERQRGFVVQEVRWSVEGVEIEGLLALPRHRSRSFSLVVDIHGGPSVAYHHSWDAAWAETITAAGYALFMPNPYGGTGRGQQFGRKNLGDPAGVEFEQILAGVRHLGDAGLVDLDRVAVMGASYGGYLTAWAVARGEVFRGGIVIAGISNLHSCWGTANNPPFYEFLCLGAPSAQRERYADRSPVNVVSKNSLPTLILHGELDQCVSVSQARELFFTLTHAGIPAELVVYPGEGHQTKQIDHIVDQRRRVMAFLAELF
jgi:dipeptidyl aminopeptidase/acylaminoacyl peptidase